ncbi:MAG: hypothetical protein ACR2QF_16055, partial [Geminicoccaceae bacterium]
MRSKTTDILINCPPGSASKFPIFVVVDHDVRTSQLRDFNARHSLIGSVTPNGQKTTVHSPLNDDSAAVVTIVQHQGVAAMQQLSDWRENQSVLMQDQEVVMPISISANLLK